MSLLISACIAEFKSVKNKTIHVSNFLKRDLQRE